MPDPKDFRRQGLPARALLQRHQDIVPLHELLKVDVAVSVTVDLLEHFPELPLLNVAPRDHDEARLQRIGVEIPIQTLPQSIVHAAEVMRMKNGLSFKVPAR